jgi:hypothetical protein
MPQSIRIATWVWFVGCAISMYITGYFSLGSKSDSMGMVLVAKGLMLLLAAPVLALQVFLFYKIWKRRRWASYALLVIVVFLTYQEFSAGFPRLPLLMFAPSALQIVSLGFLFSRSSREWALQTE